MITDSFQFFCFICNNFFPFKVNNYYWYICAHKIDNLQEGCQSTTKLESKKIYMQTNFRLYQVYNIFRFSSLAISGFSLSNINIGRWQLVTPYTMQTSNQPQHSISLNRTHTTAIPYATWLPRADKNTHYSKTLYIYIIPLHMCASIYDIIVYII